RRGRQGGDVLPVRQPGRVGLREPVRIRRDSSQPPTAHGLRWRRSPPLPGCAPGPDGGLRHVRGDPPAHPGHPRGRYTGTPRRQSRARTRRAAVCLHSRRFQGDRVTSPVMPRPKVPLLSRAKIVDAALDLIDEEGADQLNIRKLARRLEVQGPSIYHYFADRDEVLAAVGLTVLQDVRIPKRRSQRWTDWLMQDALAYYRAVEAHPN